MKRNSLRSNGEGINHFNAVRVTGIGSGNLQVIAYGASDTVVQTLVPITLSASTDFPHTRLMNVSRNRISLEFKVTELNEWFSVDRIIVFIKPLFTSIPG